MTPREWVATALEHLAMLPEDQIRYLARKGVAPLADELALELHDALQGAELAPDETEIVARVDEYLDRMSGTQNASLWTTEALSTRQEWKHVRQLAERALAGLRL